MKKLFVAVLLLAVTFVQAKEQKFGKEITLKEKSKVSAILASPDKFEGKAVLVEGKVLGVCEDAGCWIEVAGDKKGEKIKVKVEDGVIVFPKDSKGKTAVVEGTLEEVKPEAGCDKEKEMKEKDTKEASCCSGGEAKKVYQIKGLGAVIK